MLPTLRTSNEQILRIFRFFLVEKVRVRVLSFEIWTQQKEVKEF